MCNKTSSSPTCVPYSGVITVTTGGWDDSFYLIPRETKTDRQRDMEREKHGRVGELNCARILCVCETCVSCTMR